MDDDGKILAEHDADACQPSVWNAPPGQRFIGNMPANSSDVKNNGTYQLFRITFQPSVKVDRPNGWQEPVITQFPKPVGLPAGFPSFTSGTLGSKPALPLSQWNTSVPTPAPQNSPQVYPPAVTTRG